MSTTKHLDIVVVGAGMTGLTTSMLLARDGHRVTLLDRDADPPPATAEAAWDGWDRPGVSQFRQAHLMLPRWHHEMARELPELVDDLAAKGAQRVNTLHLQPDTVTHGWQPGDEQFDTVTARRPVLEAALSELATAQPRLLIRRGVRVKGLLVVSHPGTISHPDTPGVPHVRGVRTSAGDVTGDLVVDASGRHTAVPRWVRELGGAAPSEVREPCGFIYYGRHYRSHDGRMPTGRGYALTHHPSLSVLTLPCDLGTYCVVLVTSSHDRQLRVLRDERAWLAAVACSPVAAHWPDRGTPITGVEPLAGIEDVRRSYLRGGEPVVTGLVAIGDASSATNPSLGRGAAIGVIHACALRDVAASASRDPRELATRLGEATAQRVTPWVDLSLRFDRHRLAEMGADIAGTAYRPDDPTWALTTALMAGASRDPVLARASSRIAGLLAAPPEVFSDHDVQARLGPHIGGPRYPATDPTRADFLHAIDAASLAVPV